MDYVAATLVSLWGKLQNSVVESDSTEALTLVHHPLSMSLNYNLSQEIQNLKARKQHCKPILIWREANSCSKHLVNEALPSTVDNRFSAAL